MVKIENEIAMNDRLSADYCFSSNGDFLRENKGSAVILIRRTADSPALRNCVRNPEGHLDRAEIVKDSRSTKAGIVRLDDGKEIFLKRYNNKGFRYHLRYMFRKAKPFRTWRAAWFYELNGIPTPLPVAAVAERKLRILKSAYLILESVPNMISTIDFCGRMFEDPELQKIYSRSVSLMFSRMHNAGIFHGDTKLSNIFVRRREKNFVFGLWDLDGTIIKKKAICPNLRSSELARTIASFMEIAGKLNKKFEVGQIAELFAEPYQRHAKCEIDRIGLFKKIQKHLGHKQ